MSADTVPTSAHEPPDDKAPWPDSFAFDIAATPLRTRLAAAFAWRGTTADARVWVVDLGDTALRSVFDCLPNIPTLIAAEIAPRERFISLNPFCSDMPAAARNQAAEWMASRVFAAAPHSMSPAAQELVRLALRAAARAARPSPLHALSLVAATGEDVPGVADWLRGPLRARFDSLLLEAATRTAAVERLHRAFEAFERARLAELVAPTGDETRLAHVLRTARLVGVTVPRFAATTAAATLRELLAAPFVEALPAATAAPERPVWLLLLGATNADMDAWAPIIERVRAHPKGRVAVDTSGIVRADARTHALLTRLDAAVVDERSDGAASPLVQVGLLPRAAAAKAASPTLPGVTGGAVVYFAGSNRPRHLRLVSLPEAAFGYARARDLALQQHGAPFDVAQKAVRAVLAVPERVHKRVQLARMMDRAFTEEGLLQGFVKVRRAGGGAGGDGVTPERFEERLAFHVSELAGELARGVYRPRPLVRVRIPKPNGGERPIDVATVRDRVVQTAVAIPLTAYVEPLLRPAAYGYRTGIGAHTAITTARAARAQGYEWCVKADITKCFENVDHALLWRRVCDALPHDRTLHVLRETLREFARVAADDRTRGPTAGPRGIGQGSPLSPVLLNVYLTPVDARLEASGLIALRYADDILLLTRTQEEASFGLNLLVRALHEDARMTLNDAKTHVAGPGAAVTFLGVVLQGTTCRLPASKMEEFKEKIASTFDEERSVGERLEHVNQIVDGVGNYYQLIGHGVEVDLALLDDWLQAAVARFCAREGLGPGTVARFHHLPRGGPKHPGPVPSAVPYGGAKRPPPVGPREVPITPDTFDPLEVYEPSPHDPVRKPRTAEGHVFSSPDALAAHVQATEDGAVVLDHGWLRVNGYGLYVTRHGSVLVVKRKGEPVFETPLVDVAAIHVLTHGVTLSSYLLHHTSVEGVPVLLADPSGRAHGCVLPLPDGRGAGRRRAQGALLDSPPAAALARAVVAAKVENQRRTLLYFAKYLKRTNGPEGAAAWARVTEVADVLKTHAREAQRVAGGGEARDGDTALFMKEAQAAKAYWGAVGVLLTGRHAFPGRVKQGATDLVNVLLNYGYGVLQGVVWREVVAAGLDPALGFLHRSRRDSAGLVFDLMEEFRAPLVDRAMLGLLRRGALLSLDREHQLTVRSRAQVIRHLTAQLDRTVVHDGRKRALREVIQHQVRSFASWLDGCPAAARTTEAAVAQPGPGHTYGPFQMRW